MSEWIDTLLGFSYQKEVINHQARTIGALVAKNRQLTLENDKLRYRNLSQDEIMEKQLHDSTETLIKYSEYRTLDTERMFHVMANLLGEEKTTMWIRSAQSIDMTSKTGITDAVSTLVNLLKDARAVQEAIAPSSLTLASDEELFKKVEYAKNLIRALAKGGNYTNEDLALAKKKVEEQYT